MKKLIIMIDVKVTMNAAINNFFIKEHLNLFNEKGEIHIYKYDIYIYINYFYPTKRLQFNIAFPSESFIDHDIYIEDLSNTYIYTVSKSIEKIYLDIIEYHEKYSIINMEIYNRYCRGKKIYAVVYDKIGEARSVIYFEAHDEKTKIYFRRHYSIKIESNPKININLKYEHDKIFKDILSFLDPHNKLEKSKLIHNNDPLNKILILYNEKPLNKKIKIPLKKSDIDNIFLYESSIVTEIKNILYQSI